MKNPRTRRIPTLKRIISLLPTIIMGMAVSLMKLQVDRLKRIFVQIEKASKPNLLIYQEQVVMPLLSKKIKSKVIET